MTKTITINHEKKEIIVSRKFHKKASIFGTQEYTDLKAARDAEPEFKVKVKEIARNRNKKTYPNLTFKNMKKYITYKEGADSPNIHAITKLIDSADIQTSPYSFVKSWFLKNYPDYTEPDALLETKGEEYITQKSISAPVDNESNDTFNESEIPDKAA